MSKNLEFVVSIWLVDGYSGGICVYDEVTDKEYELLKKCCVEDKEIDMFKGLETLYERVVAKAIEQGVPEDSEYGTDIDYDDAEYCVEMPIEICEEVESEE